VFWLLAIPLVCHYTGGVQIVVQDEALRGLALTEDQALLDLAVGLFTERRVTLGRAARIARMSQSDFQRELGRREIPIHYDVEDLRADLRTLAALRPK
jgi:predicted HTH domain antitoxin